MFLFLQTFLKNFEFKFDNQNVKYLSDDYEKWLKKLSELQDLMRQMVTQINEKKTEKKQNVFHNFNDFLIDENLENERNMVDEKKMQMINLEAKIDALGLFNSKN